MEECECLKLQPDCMTGLLTCDRTDMPDREGKPSTVPAIIHSPAAQGGQLGPVDLYRFLPLAEPTVSRDPPCHPSQLLNRTG